VELKEEHSPSIRTQLTSVASEEEALERADDIGKIRAGLREKHTQATIEFAANSTTPQRSGRTEACKLPR